MSTEARIAEIREREQNTTKGPWLTDIEMYGVFARRMTVVRAGAKRVVSVGQTRPHHNTEAEANAEFIAHARQDIPYLLASVSALQQRVEAMTRDDAAHRIEIGMLREAWQEAEQRLKAAESIIASLKEALEEIKKKRSAFHLKHEATCQCEQCIVDAAFAALPVSEGKP